MKNKRKTDAVTSTKSSKIKEPKHTNKKEKHIVSKRDIKAIEETKSHPDSLQDEEGQTPIETKGKKKNRIFTPKKILSIGIIVVFTMLLLFYVILPTMQGSMHFLIVLSGSMAPEANPGDVVVSTYTNPEEIQINDVITFAAADNPKNCITHRVINITNENGSIGFQTKGDANEDPDQRIVQSSELIGKVVLVIPYLGYLPHFAKSPFGFITLIIIPGVLIIIGEIWKITRIKKKEPEKKKGRR
ncbi:MAG: signal peptidase I [Candidatus Heimdallarchaeota archaeon]